MRPQVLILDEPTAGLDPAAGQEAGAALERLHDQGTTLVMATHDVDLALAWADQVAVLTDGQLRQGSPAELLGDDGVLAGARLRRPWVLAISAQLHRLGVLPSGREPRDEESLLNLLLTQGRGPGPATR